MIRNSLRFMPQQFPGLVEQFLRLQNWQSCILAAERSVSLFQDVLSLDACARIHTHAVLPQTLRNTDLGLPLLPHKTSVESISKWSSA